MRLHGLRKECIVCGAKQRTGIVLLLLLATVGLQAEIENEKTYGTCTVFNHTDNFNDELLIVVRCLPRDRDETVEEELQLFIAGFADNSIVVGVAPVIPTSKQPLEYLVKKLYDTLYYSDGWHSTPQMEWRFDKEESKKSQWLLGYTGVCLQSSSEDGDNKRNFLNSVEKSDRFVIRGYR